MRENTVLAKWRAGQSTVGGWLSIPSAYSAEIMAHQGFDWLCVDMQHGQIDYPDAVRMFTAISTTATIPFVRVPWNDPAIIMKVLDAGAYGVIVPLVNTRADAELAVGACRYPPEGFRSNGANRAILYAGRDYVANANREIACIPMIETKQGIDNLDDILSVPGVNAVYIGPSDLSFALGLPPAMDSGLPLHVETVANILAACKRRGVAAGIHTGGAPFTAKKLKEGFQMVTLATDGQGMTRGVQAQVAELASLMGTESKAVSGGGPY
ncbi:MAG: aldolase/citrate lyase family protein [Dehalococcoidia bacterium]